MRKLMPRVFETMLLLRLARRLGLRDGGRLLALATVAHLDEQAIGRRERGRRARRRR